MTLPLPFALYAARPVSNVAHGPILPASEITKARTLLPVSIGPRVSGKPDRATVLRLPLDVTGTACLRLVMPKSP